MSSNQSQGVQSTSTSASSPSPSTKSTTDASAPAAFFSIIDPAVAGAAADILTALPKLPLSTSSFLHRVVCHDTSPFSCASLFFLFLVEYVNLFTSDALLLFLLKRFRDYYQRCPSPHRPSIGGDDLKKTLVSQLEFIFSKEYLASDPQLVSQLNGDFLPIASVAELPVIRVLTSDIELVKDALKSSDKIVVDEARGMARPVTKLVQRNTIIIREIPESTPQEVQLFPPFSLS